MSVHKNITIGIGTYSFDGRMFFRSHVHHMGAWWNPTISVCLDVQEIIEHLGVSADHLCNARILFRELLKQGLRRLRVLCQLLAKLLDLGAIPDGFDIEAWRKSARAGGSSSTSLLMLLSELGI